MLDIIRNNYQSKKRKIMGNKELVEKVLNIADTIITNDINYSQASEKLNMSKAMVFYYIDKYLEYIDVNKYREVRETMLRNKGKAVAEGIKKYYERKKQKAKGE